ncbi:MAG: hypothetical protein JNM56_07890 [Planctomycetia bacterium]|nr:hypothetical protein [Planctomycetia bacterium]
MSNSRWLLGLLCVSTAGVGLAPAQELFDAAVVQPATRPTEVVVVAPAKEDVAPLEPVFAANLLVGYLNGVRAEVALWRGDNHAVMGEVFYGFIATRMGGSEGAGIGARTFFRRSSKYSTNSLLLGPGCTIYSQFQNDNLLMIAPSVDISWLHGFVGSSGWETGLNLGVGFGVSGGDRNDSGAKITPLISFYTGLRY